MSAFEDAVIQRIKQLEREVERLQKWERPVIITDHGALAGLADDDHPQYRKVADSIDHGTLTGLGDNDHPQYLLTTGKAADSDKLDGYDSTDFGRPVFLAAPKTSTSWDGDAYSTTSATKIDTSAVFDIPDGVKALIVRVLARDSATFPNTSIYFQIGPASSANNQIRLYPVGGDIIATVTGICNCDANGDIYYSLASSGTGTMDCWIEIWGYWL